MTTDAQATDDDELSTARLGVPLAMALGMATTRCIGCMAPTGNILLTRVGDDGRTLAYRIETWCPTISCEHILATVEFAPPVDFMSAFLVARLRQTAFGRPS